MKKRDDGVDAELVRTRMDAELIGSQHTGDGSMFGELGLKFGEVSDIVHALFKAADIARGQTHALYAQALQFGSNVKVLLN